MDLSELGRFSYFVYINIRLGRCHDLRVWRFMAGVDVNDCVGLVFG